MIEKAKEFAAELNLLALGNVELLEQRKIEIHRSGPVEGISSQPPNAAVLRIGESSGIEIVESTITVVAVSHAGRLPRNRDRSVTPDAISSRVKIAQHAERS